MNRLMLTVTAVSTGAAIMFCGLLSPGRGLSVAAADELVLKLGAEQIPPGEDGAIEKLVTLQVAIMKKIDPTKRAQHPKHHGCVQAEFTIRDDIPKEYQVGLFKEAKTYQAKVRFSNGAQRKDDTKPDVHGMAIKVLGVKGSRALEQHGKEEQDFVLIDSENFFAPDVKTMLALMTARVASENDPDAMKKFAENHPGTPPRLRESLKSPPPSPLTVHYFSTVPFKLGDLAVKYSANPADGNGPGDANPSSENYLRAAMAERLSKGKSAVVFDLSIIPQTDPLKMPVEDPTVSWKSEPILVATIRIEPQEFDTPELMKECEALSLDPWHALAEHRPLGGINRARKAVYPASVKVRSQPPRP